MGVQNGVVRVYEKGEDGKKGQERNNASIENILMLHSIAHVGVESGKTLKVAIGKLRERTPSTEKQVAQEHLQ